MSCKTCNTNKCTCETSICINPLIYAIKSAFSLVGTDSDNTAILELLSTITKDGSPGPLPEPFVLTLPESLVEVLNSGISISNNKGYCCPDCRNGIYFLGGGRLLPQLLTVQANTKLCCIEHYATTAAWVSALKTLNNYGGVGCCNTDFSESIQDWLEASTTANGMFYLEDLIQLGIFESSSFNTFSGIGILFDFLQLDHPELTAEDYLNILGIIVNLGLVVRCEGCEMIISSVETYLSWVEATGNGGAPAVKN